MLIKIKIALGALAAGIILLSLFALNGRFLYAGTLEVTKASVLAVNPF